ncbi:MAG: hypothetical protein M3Y72_05665 [Acidobacteriota bacterium]|nr:hypothetical protein [Acidobacteriota bacterium]
MDTTSEPLEEWLTSFAKRIRRLTGWTGNPFVIFPLFLLCVWAIFNWSLTIGSIIKDYNPLPVWDYWQVAQHLERYKALDLSVFWIQHNEHRIVFPEAVFAADMLFFHGHQIFSLVVSFCCYFGVWVVLAWTFNSDKSVSPVIRKVGILLAAVVIGWQGSSVVVGNTFLLQWTMLEFTVVLSLALLAASRKSSNLFYLGSAIVAAVVATFSSANGILLWPILIAAALLLRIPKLHLLGLAVSAAVTISLYFRGFHTTNELQWLNIVEHPIYFIGFVSSYLSMPMGALGQPVAAVGFGAFNLLSFLSLLVLAARKNLLASTPAIVLFGSFVFAFATAAITTAGRMNLSDPNFLAALAARYVTLPLVNWAVLVLVLLWISARLKWELLSPSAISILACLCLTGLTSSLHPWITGNGSFIADQQVATISVENGLLDPVFEQKLYPDPGFATSMLPVLRRNDVAIYSGTPELSWLGKRAGSLFGSCSERQQGKVSSVVPVQGGFEVVGPVSSTHAPKVVFVDERSRIVGFGEEVNAGVPAAIAQTPADGQRYWVGFINSRYGSKSFSTYLVSHHGAAICPIEQSRNLQGMRSR